MRPGLQGRDKVSSELASKGGALDENPANSESVSTPKDDVCIARENDIGAVRRSRVRLNHIEQSQATAHAARNGFKTNDFPRRRPTPELPA